MERTRRIGLILCASIALFYWLAELSDKVPLLNVFRHVTFRTGAALITALLFAFPILNTTSFLAAILNELYPLRGAVG